MTAQTNRLQPFRSLGALWRYRELLRNLVGKELKLQYRGSALGFVWSLLNPLMLVIVYAIAFSFILRIQLDNYPLFIVPGVLHWGFFAGALSASTKSILGNAELIRNSAFPRVVLPVSTVTFNFVQLLFTVGVLLLAYVPLGGQFWPGFLLYPFILGLQALMVLGMALIVSALNVFFRDLEHLIQVGLRMLFFLTPIIYNFTLIPEGAQVWFRANPMVPFAIAYQELFYLREWPDPRNLLFMVFWAGASLIVGLLVFVWLEHRFAEEV